MKLFIRQSFTQADESQQAVVQDIINEIKSEFEQVHFLTGHKALDKSSFIEEFEKKSKLKFSPKTFRNYRLRLIDKCDAMIFIRTSMSESSAFELAYNLHSQQPKPVFYAHWANSPIKTTLLRELNGEYPVVYKEFNSAHDVLFGLRNFFKKYKLIERQEIFV